MKYLRIIILTLLLVLLVSPLALAASNITNALFYGIIQVSNNSTGTTNVATSANISTTNLINGGFLNSDADDCAVRNTSGADVAFMPGYTPDGYPWAMWVPSIGADSYLNYILYTTNSTGGEIQYFPAAGGMVTTDNETMELGDNFTIEQGGWAKTAFSDNYCDRRLVYKEDSIETYVSSSGNISTAITTGGSTSDNFSPNGVGDATGIASVSGAATHWEAVDDPEGAPDDGATYVSTTSTTEQIDYYALEYNSALDYAEINSVTVYFRYRNSTEGFQAFARPFLRLNGVDTEGTQVTRDGVTGDDWTDYNEALGRPGGCEWQRGDIGSLQVGVGLESGNLGTASELTQVYIVVNYTPAIGASAIGVTSATHTVTTAMGETVWLDFDGNDYVNAGNNASLQIPGALTIEAWVYAAVSGPAVAKTAFGDTDFNYLLELGNFNVSDDAGNIYSVAATTSPADSAWHHIVGVYDDPNLLLYLDGVPNGTNNIGSITLATTGGTNRDMYFGRRFFGGWAYLTGLIDEVRIYTRVLDATEVAYNFRQGKMDSPQPFSIANLVGWWHIEEGVGSPTLDETANNNDGAITGASWDTGSDLLISIDNVRQAHVDATGISVPDNANNWAAAENDSWMYLESHEIEVDGIQAQFIEWEYDNIFYDQSVNDNDATPTFRLASSDADVTANMTGFLPVSEAQAPGYVLGVAPDFIDSDALTGNVTGGFTTTPPTGGFPLADVITAVADATSTPPQLPLLIISGFVILAASLTFSALARQRGTGTIIVKIIAIVAFMGIFIALKNFGIDFWMLVVFLIISICLAMASRQLGWT